MLASILLFFLFKKDTPEISAAKQEEVSYPEARFFAPNDRIEQGDSTLLIWETEHASTVRIDPSIGRVGLAGSLMVAPDQSTIYTLYVTGNDTTTMSTLEVLVALPEFGMAENNSQDTDNNDDVGRDQEFIDRSENNNAEELATGVEQREFDQDVEEDIKEGSEIDVNTSEATRAEAELKEFFSNTLGMDFTLIEPGNFMMEVDRATQEVSINDAFYMGVSEVTQAQWGALMGKSQRRGRYPSG